MPIESIINIFTFLAFFIIAIKLYKTIKEERAGLSVQHFYYVFFFGSIYFFINSLGGTIIHDTLVSPLLGIFARTSALIAVMFLTKIPFVFFNVKKLEKVYSYLMLVIISISTGMAMFGLERVEKIGERPDNLLTSYAVSVIGLTLFTSLLIATISFIYFAFKKRGERNIFIRSLILGGGCFFILLGATINYILLGMFDYGRLYAVISLVLGALFFIFGVFFRKD